MTFYSLNFHLLTLFKWKKSKAKSPKAQRLTTRDFTSCLGSSFSLESCRHSSFTCSGGLDQHTDQWLSRLESRGEGEGEVIDALVIELGKTISQELFGALLALALSRTILSGYRDRAERENWWKPAVPSIYLLQKLDFQFLQRINRPTKTRCFLDNVFTFYANLLKTIRVFWRLTFYFLLWKTHEQALSLKFVSELS